MREPATDDLFFLAVVITTVILLLGTVFLFVNWSTAESGVLKLGYGDCALALAVYSLRFAFWPLYLQFDILVILVLASV